nr:DUF1636 family protein [Planosporangium flavigriseum]
MLICRTCPRYDARASGEFGRRLTAAIAAIAAIAEIAEIAAGEPDAPVAIRNVQCLGGCPEDGVVAVDAPGKARIRFTGLTESYAEAILAAAAAHHASPSGLPADWAVPTELAGHLSSVTVKRLPGRLADPGKLTAP